MGKRVKSQDNMIVGDNIRKHREHFEMSRDALAERLGLSSSYLADVERGTVGISIKTLKELCGVLSVSADALLFEESAGVDSLLRGLDTERIDSIRELVILQLKIMKP